MLAVERRLPKPKPFRREFVKLIRKGGEGRNKRKGEGEEAERRESNTTRPKQEAETIMRGGRRKRSRTRTSSSSGSSEKVQQAAAGRQTATQTRRGEKLGLELDCAALEADQSTPLTHGRVRFTRRKWAGWAWAGGLADGMREGWVPVLVVVVVD